MKIKVTTHEKSFLPVLRCKNCKTLMFPESASEKQCLACGSLNMDCDHPCSHLDPIRNVYICSFCGQKINDSILDELDAQIRPGAEDKDERKASSMLN